MDPAGSRRDGRASGDRVCHLPLKPGWHRRDSSKPACEAQAAHHLCTGLDSDSNDSRLALLSRLWDQDYAAVLLD